MGACLGHYGIYKMQLNHQNLVVGGYPEECLNSPNIPMQAPTPDPKLADRHYCIVALPMLRFLAKWAVENAVSSQLETGQPKVLLQGLRSIRRLQYTNFVLLGKNAVNETSVCANLAAGL